MPDDPSRVGLPPRVFLYTVDQLSVIIGVSEQKLHQSYLWHEGRDIGRKERHEMLARNIAPPQSPADWRVAETELIRWLKGRGFKYYDRGTITK